MTPYKSNGRAKQRHVSVSYAMLFPFVTNKGSQPKGSDIELVHTLSTSLGFTYDLKYAQDFKDLILNVVTGDADFCISHPAVVVQRYKHGLDVLALSVRKYVLVQRYPIRINSMHTITQPFTLNVWLTIMFTIVSIFVILAFLNR